MAERIPTLLILVDGLRPEALDLAPMPTLLQMRASANYSIAHSLAPFCTLPCHYSIFHSVPPTRHGVTSNVFSPPVRPIAGLFETLKRAGKRCGMVYNWEQLRDVVEPGHLNVSRFEVMRDDHSGDEQMATHTIEVMNSGEIDFLFCYLGETDESGHKYGWLSEGYLQTAQRADAMINRVLAALPSQSRIVIMADHGGHDRTHGLDCPDDKHVPLLIQAPGFHVEWGDTPPTLLHIAPTVATLCGVASPKDWEGRSLVSPQT